VKLILLIKTQLCITLMKKTNSDRNCDELLSSLLSLCRADVKFAIFNSPQIEVRSIAMNVSVCLSVARITQKRHVQTPQHFVYMLSTAVARSSDEVMYFRSCG